ncbi:MAG: hypothetical protein Q9M13_06345 [Mariprofundales bacterium]|nr:hypothetical protein [Mariprofundales bacterium]
MKPIVTEREVLADTDVYRVRTPALSLILMGNRDFLEKIGLPSVNGVRWTEEEAAFTEDLHHLYRKKVVNESNGK